MRNPIFTTAAAAIALTAIAASPAQARFMQTDPIAYDDGMNLYAYVGNDPVNLTDPTGMRNCNPDDPFCVETPESAEQPGEPEPPSEAEEVMGEAIVVTGQRPEIDYSDDNEEFFVVTVLGGEMKPRPMSRSSVDCGGGRTVTVGTVAPLGAGEMGTHSHGSGLEQHPGPRDDSAARGSTRGVAGVMTRERSFTVRMFPNGSFRTRQVEGSQPSGSERSALIGNMQNWEGNVPQPGQSTRSQVCPN